MIDLRVCGICAKVRDEEDRIIVPGDQFICNDHLSRVATLLDRIARYHAHLADPETLVRSRDTDAERWVGSKAPCDTHLLSMTDWRTRHLAKGDPVSAERVLRAWLYAILEYRSGGQVTMHDHPMPRHAWPVYTLVRHLIGALPWMASSPAVVRFARHVAYLHATLRPFVR